MKLDNRHLLFIVCSVFLIVLICFYINSCNKAKKNIVVPYNEDAKEFGVIKSDNKSCDDNCECSKKEKKIWSNVNKLKKDDKQNKNKSNNVQDFNTHYVKSDKPNFNSQSTLGEPENWEMSGVYWHSAKAPKKGM